MSTEVSFLDALKARYGTDDVDQYDANAFLVGDVSRKSNKKWELVGMEKTRQKQERYDRLVEVVLKSSAITVAVKSAEVTAVAADSGETGGESAPKDALATANMVRLRELDLSGNVDLPLSELGKLIGYFPSLTGLQVSDVPALLTAAPSPPSPSSVSPVAPLFSSQTLTKLVFNNVGFRSVFQLRRLVHVPNLTELHLDNNGLTNFSLFACDEEARAFSAAHGAHSDDVFAPLRFAHVTTLSLAHNKINTWGCEDSHKADDDNGVQRGVGCGLGYTLTAAFPAVARLFLTNNAMPNMDLPASAVEADVAARVKVLQQTPSAESASEAAVLVPSHLVFLRSLSLLCLNDNATLTDPGIVDAVRVVCPSLETFRVTYGNLLPQWNESLSRMYVVASLPTVQLLNRGQVRPKERLDSELFYVQRGIAMREQAREAETSGESPVPAASTPSYALLDYLQEKHKDTVLSIYKEGSTAGSDGTAHRMLDVTLFFENGYKKTVKGHTQSTSTVARQLPSSLTVGKLKALIKVVFQVDPVNQVLSYRSGDDGVLQVPIELSNESQTLAYYGVSNGAIISITDSSLR